MRYLKFLIVISLLSPVFASAQIFTKNVKSPATVTVEGKVFDEVSGTALNQARVTVFDDMMKASLAQAETDASGSYKIKVPKMARYRVLAEKATYFDSEQILSPADGPLQANLGLGRKSGYEFDITIFDKAYEHNTINTLRDCKVEIYNNTTAEQVLTIEKLAKSTFNFSFAEGNHYTVLVRKKGYLNRRIEVYVNVNGCILCVDGMGIQEPDLVPLMTHNNEIGHFLGTIDLDSIAIGKRFQLNNIYYDFDKWAIRPEAASTLDNLAVFLKDNPGITIELGSHTDSRGSDDYNMLLSDKRAASAVAYLVDKQHIDSTKITSKGYGESQLVNSCGNGVNCSESDHQQNRRTEIKITGVIEDDPMWFKTLKQIIEDKQLYKKIIDQEKKAKELEQQKTRNLEQERRKKLSSLTGSK
ncbi:MAG: OmpA family protein [Saprospiraceae bacterium]|nr:OmpA family protein [Saprospiraceae bacterium]